MTDLCDMVSVRYMVDDVEESVAFYTLYEVSWLRSSEQVSRFRGRRPRQTAVTAQWTGQLRGSAHAGWRQAGTRRLEPHSPHSGRHRCRSRPPPRRGCSVSQRYPRKDQAAGRSCSKTPSATSSNSSNPPPSTQRDETPRVGVSCKGIRWFHRQNCHRTAIKTS